MPKRTKFRQKGGAMDKNFAIGLALGIICGALVVSNSYKARKLVKDSQTQIKEKVIDSEQFYLNMELIRKRLNEFRQGTKV